MTAKTHGVRTPRRRFASVLAAGLALALPVSGIAAAGAAAQEEDDRLVLDHGHIDAFNIDVDDSGNPILNLKEDVTGNHVRHAPEDVVLHVKEDALRELPPAAGIPSDLHGQSVYYLPLTQDHNLIWPGWDSQSLNGTEWASVDINVESVEGPGDVYLWSNGSFGELSYLLNGEQTQLPGTIHQSYFAHVHANWAFTQPGEYTLDVNAQAQTAEGEASPVTETHSYTFTVGDYENPDPDPEPGVPSASIQPASITAADLAQTGVTISGIDFAAGSEVAFLVNGREEATELADENGAVSFQYSAEGASPGVVPVELVAGDQRAEASFVVTDEDGEEPEPEPTPDPTASVNPDTLTVSELANPGVTVTGQDFAEGSDVALHAFGSQLETKPADANGAVTFQLTAEDVAPGEYTAQLRSGELRVFASFTVEEDPAEELVPALERCEAIFPGEKQICIDEGHVDAFYVTPGSGSDSGVKLLVKEDVTEVNTVRDPDAVGFIVKQDALLTLPESDFVPEELQGERAYYLPNVQDHNLLWPGWDSQALNGSGWGTPVEIEIVSVDGPGEVFLWGNGESLLNGGSYQLPGTITQDYLAHVHANWAFTDPGDYTFEVRASAASENGVRTATSETRSYEFFVGDATVTDRDPVDDPGDVPQPNPKPGDDGDSGNGDGAGGNNNSPSGNNPAGEMFCVPDSNAGGNGNQNQNGSGGQPVVGNDGHFDIGPGFVDGELQLLVKDDRQSPPVWVHSNDVRFDLGDAAHRPAREIPADLDFIANGGDLYMIQSVQEPNVPWVGWNTQHETIVPEDAQITLVSVDGPGELAVFNGGAFGQVVGDKVFDTVGGPSSYTIPSNTHQHSNWAFTEAGTYRVTIEVSTHGETASGTITFSVGGGAGGGTAEQDTGESNSGPAMGIDQNGNPCSLPRTGSEQIAPTVVYAVLAALLVGGLLVTRRRKLI